MTSVAITQEALDQLLIQNVVVRNLIARDSGLWQELADSYHPDAKLTTSWFNGSPADFVKGSSEMKIARHEGESQKHMTGNHRVQITGRRATLECDLILYQRRVINGVELDFTTWSRRLHLLEKRNGDWKIWQQTVIYEKDRLDPAHPGGLPADFFAGTDFSKYPPQIRYHCWRNDLAGFPHPKNICLKGTDREGEVRAAAAAWLADG